MRTYEELLAAQTELAHFNPNHDPNIGRFSANSGTSSNGDTAKYEKKIAKRMTKAADFASSTSAVVDEAYKQMANGGSSFVSKNTASYFYDQTLRQYKKLDKLIAKCEPKGITMEGKSWEDFNKQRIDLGNNFIERATSDKALRKIIDTVMFVAAVSSGGLGGLIYTAAKPSIMGSSQYELKTPKK